MGQWHFIFCTMDKEIESIGLNPLEMILHGSWVLELEQAEIIQSTRMRVKIRGKKSNTLFKIDSRIDLTKPNDNKIFSKWPRSRRLWIILKIPSMLPEARVELEYNCICSDIIFLADLKLYSCPETFLY